MDNSKNRCLVEKTTTKLLQGGLKSRQETRVPGPLNETQLGRKAAQILQGLSAMVNFTSFTSQEEAIQIVKAREGQGVRYLWQAACMKCGGWIGGNTWEVETS